jgi:hypothetical protein
MSDAKSATFCVYGETENGDVLMQLGLDVGSLLSDHAEPYEAGRSFILDGANVKKGELRRFKILAETEYFRSEMDNVGWWMRRGGDEVARSKLTIEGYETIVNDLMRQHTKDVTATMVTAVQGQMTELEEVGDDPVKRFDTLGKVAQTAFRLLELAEKVKDTVG